MQYQKCSIDRYVDFLVASQKQFSGSELARVSPETMAHDSVSRWLSTATLTPRLLWNESSHLIDRTTGYLVVDDSLLDKPYAEHMALVKAQYSGKHHGIVKGIDLVNALWTDGDKIIPVDYRVYDPTRDGKTKNDHAREMLRSAKQREFKPSFVLIDAWFTSIDNLKAIASYGWRWIGVLQHNRLVSVEKGSYVRVSDLDWTSTQVHKVWLKAYGFVLVSKTVAPNGDVTYLATNDTSLFDAETFKNHFPHHWTIETFHRGIKQTTGIEKCYAIKERSQRNHILCAFLAFLRFEWERIQNTISWYEQKLAITRPAISAYMS